MSGPLAIALVARLGGRKRWFDGRLVPEPAPTLVDIETLSQLAAMMSELDG